MRRLLGPTLGRRFDWSTLALLPGTYVDASLAGSACDVLLSVRFRRTRRRALLYILLEHQRRPDGMMPLRMLEYACRAWDDYMARSDAIRDYLPPLIPLLVHQGPERWRGARSLSELHRIDGEDPGMPPCIELHMQIHELRDDLVFSPQLTVLARTALHVMRLIAAEVIHRENAATMARWFREVQDAHGNEALEALVRYISTADRSGKMIEAIVREAPEEFTDDLVAVRGSLGDRLLRQGRARGKLEGEARIVLRQLRARFRRVPRAVARRVTAGTSAELERWADRLLTASSLAEVFAEDE